LDRGDHDALAGVDPHGVHVLHGADDHAVVLAVPHHLVLQLLPAEHALLDEHLVDAGVDEPAANDRDEFLLVVSDAPSGAAEGVGGADEDRKPAHRLDRPLRVLDVGDGDAARDRLAYPEHGLPEQLPVLRESYGARLGAEQAAVQPL